MVNFIELIMLIISFATLSILYIYIAKIKNKKIIHKEFMAVVASLSIYVIGFILQILFSGTDIPPVKFEYIAFIGMATSPVIAFCIGMTYYKGDSFSIKKLWWLFIIPIVTILIIWIDDEIIFKNYSTNLTKIEYGAWFYVYTVYTYVMYAAALILNLTASIRKSGFLSAQSLFISLGAAVPIITNILLLAGLFEGSVYITPILFSFVILCFFIAIIKFKAFNITPIAFRTIIDTMSDAYIVISNDGTIVDNNHTFHNIFKDILDDNKDDNFMYMLSEKNLLDVNDLNSKIDETRTTGKIVTAEYHIEVKDEKNSTEDEIKYIFNRYFEVDIHPIKASRGKEYVGTLLLFKDVTQHMQDMAELEQKQDVIIKQQQLVSIGELAGGVAHDINTPISAIKTGITMLQTFYEPRDEREEELISRMDNCTERIIKIVNSMRNQIRNLGNKEKVKFKVSDVLKDTQVITFNEFQKKQCSLNINIQDDVEVMGEPTKLGQVFTNLIVNAVQAYPEGQGGKVEVDVSNAPEGKCIIKIRDYAGGIPDRIKDSVFKNILTTKGTKGTGLGLYLAYSVIKGEFSGDITFETEKGEGTTFYIVLDRAEIINAKKEEKQANKESV